VVSRVGGPSCKKKYIYFLFSVEERRKGVADVGLTVAEFSPLCQGGR